MNTPSETPMGQPITPGIGGPQYVPQPLDGDNDDSSLQQPGKHSRLLVVGVAVLIALAVLVGGGLWWAKSATTHYQTATATYKADLTKARDAINDDFAKQHIGLSSAEAPAVLKKGAQNMTAVINTAPRRPAVFWVIPVGGDSAAQTANLTAAANRYVLAMQDVFATYDYYVAVTSAFKPIKDLGTITPDNQDKLVANWETYSANIADITPPADLAKTHKTLVDRAATITGLLQQMVANANNPTAYSNLVTQTDKAITQANSDFVDAVSGKAQASNQTVNQRYDELDTLLKK